MDLVYKNSDDKLGKSNKKKLISTTIVGVVFLLISIMYIFVDPFLLVVEYRLRLDNGTLLNDIILTELEGPKLYIYLFNISNAEEFRLGLDEKLKLKEVGPFVYQEYRTNRELEINLEPGIMRYTPKVRVEYILEESIGPVEDIYLTLPNIPMLAATSLMSKYPYVMRQLFNVIAAGIQSKAFINISAFDYFWGYPDPLISMANRAVPGLIYFKSIGLLERFYDFDVECRMELGTTNSDKFRIKSIKRKIKQDEYSTDFSEKATLLNDSYEGAAFPTGITPEMKISIYRHSICKPFQLQNIGFKSMFYGGEALLYNFHNMTFMDHQLCDSTGWCPEGLMNLAPCYFDIPLALSKGHLLDVDPLLLERVEGLKPDSKIHDAEIAIDPKIAVTVFGAVSLQINIFLADVGYNAETKIFKNTTVLPLSHVITRHPKMLKEVKTALHLLYKQSPAIILATQILCLILGLGFLLYSSKLIYSNRVVIEGTDLNKNSNIESIKVQIPLVDK